MGCWKMDDNLDDLNVVVKKLQRKEMEKTLSIIMEEQNLSLSDEVEAVADNEGDEEKKSTLKSAAVIIREKEKAKNPFIVRIFREDDLTGALEKEFEIKIKC